MRKQLAFTVALSTLSLLAQAPSKPADSKKAPAAAPATESKKAPAKASETKPTPTPATSGLVGNKDSKVFHAATCRAAGKMKAEHKVNFASKAEAEKAGYKACKMCKP